MAGENGNEGGNNGGNGPEGAGAGEGAKGGDDKGKQQEGFKPVTFSTQEEFDKAFGERATRAADTAKAEALKSFTEAGIDPATALEKYNEWKAAEDAKKDPAVREREAHAETQRKLQAYQAKEQREALAKDVAKDLKIGETPIPADLLHGSTKEEMEANGKALIAFIEVLAGKPGPRAPGYNPDQGNNHSDRVTSGDPIRNLFETGSFQ